MPSPPIQYYGGKQEMAEQIIRHFPPHITYVEPCGGMAGVLLAKPPSPVEVYNDIDGRLVNFWRQVRDNGEELAAKLLATPYARAEYERCREPADDPLEDARRFATVARQSHGGAWGRSWSYVVSHSRRGMASGVSRWLSLPQDVLAVMDRVASVQIECLDVVRCIEKYDRPGTLFYIDPPYLAETRNGAKVYRHEMSEQDHVTLLDAAKRAAGNVIISSYRNDLYDSALGDWRVIEFEVPCRSNIRNSGAGSRPTRTECAYISPAEEYHNV